jgi:serine/threonine-protein kinase HipA
MRRGIVRLDGVIAGVIEEIEHGSRFEYDAGYLARPGALPISLTLPLRTEPYLSRSLHPFFENLLPEGWLLELSTAKLKIAKDDAFGLLLATCADCIGAVEIVASRGS